MYNLILWGCSFCMLASQAFSQAPDSVIRMETTFWGIRYVQGDRQLSFKELGVELAADPGAFAEYRQARTSYVVSTVVSLTGAVLIGYSVGSALTGKAPHWSVAVAGAGVLLTAVPFNNAFHRRIRQAIGTHNSRMASSRHTYWQIEPRGTGVSLVLRF